MTTTALTLSPTAASSRAVAVRDPWALVAKGPLGNLDAYISATHQIPMLSAEEEQDLAERLQKDNDLEAARRLVLSHLRLVVAVARQYLGYGLPHADLIQEGNIGLMKAVKRYDPTRGVRLVSFAMHWIKAEIHEYIIRNWRMVKMITTKAHRKLFFNLNSFKKFGQTLSQAQIREVADELNVRPEDVSDMERRMAGHEFSLDPIVNADSEESTYNPVQYLAAEGAEPSEVIDMSNQERLHTEGLELALSSLDERSQRIISSRWLAGDQSKTLHDLAAELGVSAERVRQIEVQAMKKMKQALLKYENEAA
ncbi:RNA polymerase sigma factor RpoH [Limnobacter sp.]|uniref:RNA polymerase sigma factor RpoH n=1 Tax=Limnobacter sp. TaxID=2003368 RepID=UPI0025853461|nr:RNA polymerase sigma factor RpoH [Limnobacter sp.]